jgi:tetratricopeptide (TPR) repeat protein
MTDVDGGTARYTAFLSYSHRDAAAARWLHRKLETYRMPRRLVGFEGERGPVPARLTPIFRDREELPAAGDLSEKVRAALAASDNLIILCSPNSAASPWVAKEIAAYRELHPGKPVFAAIVEGEPDQCFPAGLAEGGAEPLAADLRPGRDGRRLGFLKLVAGLTGVGLDALVQRDAQRRLRRVTAVTAAALAAMLVMAVLTAFALSARSEAERQRAKAEGLIEFMLTDLRDTLKEVGRLDAMAAVNERAIGYYGGQRDLDTMADESLARRARILHVMGEDALALDDLEGALSAYREAWQTTAELLVRAPGNPQRLMEHGKSHVGIGMVHERRDDWSAAQFHYSAFAAAADRLLAGDPQNPGYMMKAASAAIDLGNIQLRGTKDFPAAQRSYEKAVFLLKRAADARPDDVHALLGQANAFGWLADSFYARNMWRSSLHARLEQYAVVDRLHKERPDSAEIWFRLAAARRGVLHSLVKLGDRTSARAHLFAAFDMAGRLTRLDPENAEWRQLNLLLARDLLRLGLGYPEGVAESQLQVQIRRWESSHARKDGHHSDKSKRH